MDDQASDAPILDEARIDELRSLLGDGAEGVDGLVDTFVERIPAVIEDLRGAAAVSDQEEMVHLAHKIKGEASTLGAERLSQQAKSIEMQAREEDLADPSAAVEALVETYEETERAFESDSSPSST